MKNVKKKACDVYIIMFVGFTHLLQLSLRGGGTVCVPIGISSYGHCGLWISLHLYSLEVEPIFEQVSHDCLFGMFLVNIVRSN